MRLDWSSECGDELARQDQDGFRRVRIHPPLSQLTPTFDIISDVSTNSSSCASVLTYGWVQIRQPMTSNLSNPFEPINQ